MSVSALSPTRALGGVSGLLQVVSLLGLVLLLLKVAQLYLRRQWLLKALHQFPSPPSHWFYGHKKEVGWSRMGEWEGREGWGKEWSRSVSPWDKAFLCDQRMAPQSNTAYLLDLGSSSSPGGSLLPGPVLVSSGLSDTPSSGSSQAVLETLPFEDNGCSLLTLPALQAEQLQLSLQNRLLDVSVLITQLYAPCLAPSLPGSTDISLMDQPCGFTVCRDNTQESKMVRVTGKEAHFLGRVMSGIRKNWLGFLALRDFSWYVITVLNS